MSTPTYPVSTIAKLFNLTERRVQQLASEGVIPKPERGKYDLVASVRGYIAYLQERAFGKEIIHVDAHQERARLLKAQADKTELEVKTIKGELMSQDQIAEQWSGFVMATRSRLLSLPTRGAHLAMGLKEFHEIKGGLEELVREALNEIALYDPRKLRSIDLQDSEIDGTTAESDGEPVGGHAPPAE